MCRKIHKTTSECKQHYALNNVTDRIKNGFQRRISLNKIIRNKDKVRDTKIRRQSKTIKI